MTNSLSVLLLQLVLIIAATQCVGAVFARFKQPFVVGEVAAGILLGPSLFGRILPDTFEAVFKSSSLGTLELLGQIGVCLFMFLVGMELDTEKLRHRSRVALVVSPVSIIVPFLLGLLLAQWLYPRLAANGAAPLPFALFMGISLSITAFPVLSKILVERGMTQGLVGSTALTCAAVDDATAWCALALIVSGTRQGWNLAGLVNIALVAGFALLVLFGLRPLLRRWLDTSPTAGGEIATNTVPIVLILALVGALTTQTLGIHALFGAFLIGVAMPPAHDWRLALRAKLETTTSVLLLPLFFAFTGLRMQVALIQGVAGWGICLGILLVATIGKLGASMLAARCTGFSWANAFRLGALMNTRGLVELVALNIGYDLGILSRTLFSMMVLMALGTTLLTGPLLNAADRYLAPPQR